jgi:hypothetical protein
VEKSVNNVTAETNTRAHYYPALGSYWLAHETRRGSSEPMATGQHSSLSPSGPNIIIIPTDSSFCPATCSRWFIARLIFDPEDRGYTFLRNVGLYTEYTVLCPRIWQISIKELLDESFYMRSVSYQRKIGD